MFIDLNIASVHDILSRCRTSMFRNKETLQPRQQDRDSRVRGNFKERVAINLYQRADGEMLSTREITFFRKHPATRYISRWASRPLTVSN